MNHDNHDMHHVAPKDSPKEYAKFAAVLTLVGAGAYILTQLTDTSAMFAVMGVFLVTFAGFKLINLKEFAFGFQSYDLIAKKSLSYSYAYPFIQLVLGVLYISGIANVYVHVLSLVVALVSSVGVLNSLMKKQAVHCVCLGNVIKLPLSRISFVEDFGMAIMALIMIINR